MKVKAQKPAPAKTIDCDGCSYLTRYYPDVPLEVLKPHCGRHRVEDSAMHADGLANTDPKFKPEPSDDVPDGYLDLMDPWDGQLRTVWASAGYKPPTPASGAWEHLIEWALEVRIEQPRLTVQAMTGLLRYVLPSDYQAHKRLPKLFPDEYAAEREVTKRLIAEATKKEDAPAKPKVKESELTMKEMQEENAKIESTPLKKFMAAGIPSSKAPMPVTESAALKPSTEAKVDAWGYRLGTRSATINEFFRTHPGKWYTAADIERLTKTTSASPHLSSLAANDRLEHKKVEGSRTGQYRLKA